MGLKLVDSVDLAGYFITHPNTILTFQRNIKIEKMSPPEIGYKLIGIMRLYTEENYSIVTLPGMDHRPYIFEQELSYNIAPEVLDTNLSGFLYSKMMELYPTAVPC